MRRFRKLLTKNKVETSYPSEMTAKALNNLIWGSEKVGKDGQKSRKMKKEAVLALVPTRYVPLDVLEMAEKYLDDPLRVSNYVHSAFCIYRGSVSGEFAAPHVFKEKTLEWPEPVDFSWSEMEAVLAGSKFVWTGLEGKVEISSREGDYKKVTEIDVRRGEKKEKIKKLSIGDKLGSTMKYKIPDVYSVGLIAQQPWQITSLRWYANYLSGLRDNLSKGVPVEEERLQSLPKLINDLKKPVELPVIYLKKGAKKEGEYQPDLRAWFGWGQ